jgi:hypothetical protein
MRKKKVVESFEIFEPEVPAEAVVAPAPDMVEVRLLNHDEHDGMYAVITTSAPVKGYLVPKDRLVYSIRPQSVDSRVLTNESIELYDWTEELDQMAFSYDQLREALWYYGMFHKHDFDPHEFILKLISRGRFPVKNRS